MTKIRIITMIIIAGLMVCLSIIPASPVMAHDYSYSGCKWFTDTVYYDDSYVNSTWRWEIWQAQYTWSSAGADFVFVQDTGDSDNDIYIGECDDPNHVAETDLRDIDWNTGEISELDMIFNEDEDFSVGGGLFSYDIQTVALHEFGHFLMLLDLYSGHSDYVMYYIYNGVKTELHDGEDDGIIYIYGEA